MIRYIAVADHRLEPGGRNPVERMRKTPDHWAKTSSIREIREVEIDDLPRVGATVEEQYQIAERNLFKWTLEEERLRPFHTTNITPTGIPRRAPLDVETMMIEILLIGEQLADEDGMEVDGGAASAKVREFADMSRKMIRDTQAMRPVLWSKCMARIEEYRRHDEATRKRMMPPGVAAALDPALTPAQAARSLVDVRRLGQP